MYIFALCWYSADSAGTERDTDGSEFDVRDAGNGHVAERRVSSRIIRCGAASDGRYGLAHGREQRRWQHGKFLACIFFITFLYLDQYQYLVHTCVRLKGILRWFTTRRVAYNIVPKFSHA